MTTNASETQWKYLEQCPSSWRKQLYPSFVTFRIKEVTNNQNYPERVND